MSGAFTHHPQCKYPRLKRDRCPDCAFFDEEERKMKRSQDLAPFKVARRVFERQYVRQLLRYCRGNVSQAARIAEKDRKDFYDLIKRTGLDPADFR